MTRLFLAIFLTISLCVPFEAYAVQNFDQRREQVRIYQQDMQRIESYLNNIKTFVAPFIQRVNTDEISTGTFYLSRPGKLRWEYDPPAPVIIVANGSLLTYFDVELGQISHVSLDNTLAGFLTREKISFTDGIEILKFDKKQGYIYITIAQDGKREEGSLTLIFRDEALQLVGIEVLDPIGKITNIEFEGVTHDMPLSKKLFVIQRVKKKKQ